MSKVNELKPSINVRQSVHEGELGASLNRALARQLQGIPPPVSKPGSPVPTLKQNGNKKEDEKPNKKEVEKTKKDEKSKKEEEKLRKEGEKLKKQEEKMKKELEKKEKKDKKEEKKDKKEEKKDKKDEKKDKKDKKVVASKDTGKSALKLSDQDTRASYSSDSTPRESPSNSFSSWPRLSRSESESSEGSSPSPSPSPASTIRNVVLPTLPQNVVFAPSFQDSCPLPQRALPVPPKRPPRPLPKLQPKRESVSVVEETVPTEAKPPETKPPETKPPETKQPESPVAEQAPGIENVVDEPKYEVEQAEAEETAASETHKTER